MTLKSEMSRLTSQFEAAQGARLAAIAKIGATVKRESHKNKASLSRTMAAHRTAVKGGLRDIFGTAAFTRSAAEEMVERFKNEREKCASDLREQLASYVTDLQETVGKELAHLTATRTKMARREENLRRTQLKDLRQRVETLLANSVKLIDDFNKDREQAGKIWGKHLRTAPRQKRAATHSAAKSKPRKHKAQKRKHTHA
jgi:hypothetical protein